MSNTLNRLHNLCKRKKDLSDERTANVLNLTGYYNFEDVCRDIPYGAEHYMSVSVYSEFDRIAATLTRSSNPTGWDTFEADFESARKDAMFWLGNPDL